MEAYEIYNGRIPFESFKEIIFRRYKNYQSNNGIFECSIFQNIIETMVLFYNLSEKEIINFYQELKQVINFNYRILYIDSNQISQNFLHDKKVRVNEDGHEMWFKFMLDYFINSTYARVRNLTSIDDLISYFQYLHKLEMQILQEVFTNNYQDLDL